MAVSNNYEIKNYTLDGIATQFAIPFDVTVDDYGNAINIVVYLGLTELTKDVDYTISVKTINYPDAVSHTGEKLTVFRRTPIEQPVDFVDNGNFTLEDIETGLDRSIMIEQETAANLDNTITAQESMELAEQYKDIAIEKASDAEDWAVGTRSDGETPSHSLESSKHWAEAADTSAGEATSMRNQSAASALVSEGWAKGTQSGTPVDNTSPYYQANSKYYKEQAALSAGAASGSATSAYNSELAAAASEDMAEKWAENPIDTEVETGRYSAKHWAAKASVSAGAAAVSAYNAGLSETAADTSAKDSEAWAVGKRGGSDVDPTDPAYHNNAKYYADQIGAQTVTPDNTVTLTNKTISYDDNTLTGVVGESATQTLTNKTISYADNTLTGVQKALTLTDGVEVATGRTYGGRPTYLMPIRVETSGWTKSTTGNRVNQAYSKSMGEVIRIVAADGYFRVVDSNMLAGRNFAVGSVQVASDLTIAVASQVEFNESDKTLRLTFSYTSSLDARFDNLTAVIYLEYIKTAD